MQVGLLGLSDGRLTCLSCLHSPGEFALDETSASSNRCLSAVSGSNTHFVLGNATSSCGIPITNMIIRHNISARSGSAFVVLDTNAQSVGTSKNVVYNNSFCNWYPAGTIPTWLDYITMNSSTDSSGINNLFYRAMDYGNARGFLWASGGQQAYNLYYDSDHIMTFTSPETAETGAVKNQDPSLADPVFLYMDSDGTQVLNGPAPDIGAIEYGTDVVRDNSGSSRDGGADNGGGGCFTRMLLR